MTNADKYLKDGVSAEEFARIILEDTIFNPTQEDIIAFLNKPCKPTLTEDERVILRNIDENEYQKIARQDGALFLINDNVYGGRDTCYMFGIIFKSDLFQFVKNGEEYEIAKLLKGE